MHGHPRGGWALCQGARRPSAVIQRRENGRRSPCGVPRPFGRRGPKTGVSRGRGGGSAAGDESAPPVGAPSVVPRRRRGSFGFWPAVPPPPGTTGKSHIGEPAPMALCDIHVAGCGEHLPAWGLRDDRMTRALIRPSEEDAMGRSCIVHPPPPPRQGDARSSTDACLSWQKVQRREAKRRLHRQTEPTTKALCQPPPPPVSQQCVACRWMAHRRAGSSAEWPGTPSPGNALPIVAAAPPLVACRRSAGPTARRAHRRAVQIRLLRRSPLLGLGIRPFLGRGGRKAGAHRRGTASRSPAAE